MNKALIVIDAQKYFSTQWTKVKVKSVVKKIQKYLKKHLKNYSFVYFTIFRNDKNSPLWKIAEWRELTGPKDTDLFDELKEFTNSQNLVYKNILSAAKKPEILASLKKNNVQEIHLCGFDTDCCILATAYDLFDMGFKPVVLENLTWSTSKDNFHSSAIKMLKRNIGFVKNL